MFNPHKNPVGVQQWLAPICGAILLVTWIVLTSTGMVSPAKLPSPMAIGESFVRLAWDSEQAHSPLLIAIGWSFGRVLIATLLVIVIGTPIGILMGASQAINNAISFLFDPFRSAPVAALLPIFVMWLGIDEELKIAFLFTCAVVFYIPAVRDAIKAVPQTQWISAHDLGATELEVVRHTLIPLALPRIADAIMMAFSISFTYLTVAEYVNAQQGLGQIISQARRSSAMDQVFVGILTIIALAMISNKLMEAAKKKLFPWEASQ